MTDNDTPKHDRELVIVMNEDGEMDSGPSIEEACGRLDRRYVGNMLRAVKVTVHMAPPAVEDQGDFIVMDLIGRTFKIERRD